MEENVKRHAEYRWMCGHKLSKLLDRGIGIHPHTLVTMCVVFFQFYIDAISGYTLTYYGRSPIPYLGLGQRSIIPLAVSLLLVADFSSNPMNSMVWACLQTRYIYTVIRCVQDSTVIWCTVCGSHG